MPLRITDLNKEGGIGSNSLWLELGTFNIVVDAGLHPKLTGNQAMPDFTPLDDCDVDAVIVTHCHLDHIGSLPVLLGKHPEARVFMSQASSMLIERMLHNSCNVMKRQKAEHSILEYPLFTHSDVDTIKDRFEPLPFETALTISNSCEELSLKLHQAGHVAGAGGFEIRHQGTSIFLTGDVLFDAQRTLDGAKFPEEKAFDVVVLETTRGETERPEGKTRESEVERLLETIRSTLRRGGSTLIPVFALGRMQEILTIINDARKSGDIPQCPVFGAGLGLDLAGYLDQISKRTGSAKFSNRVIRELKLLRPPRRLTPGREPKQQGIYILSSGMMVARTPSYNMAASLIGQARNSILFVGYCDPDTPGGQLQNAIPGDLFLFETLDYQVKLKAQVERFELSGHADRNELLDFALAAKPRSIVLTHGDPGARDWFQNELLREAPNIKVIDPKPMQAVEV